MVERNQSRPGAASTTALALALGAVALWATNALVGKTLLASHPVSHVQFLQFCGAALVFALIRLAGASPSPLVGSEARARPVARPGGGLATRGRMRAAGRVAEAGVSSSTPHPSRPCAPIHLLPLGEKGKAYAVGFIGLVGTMVLQYIAFASMPVIEANLIAYTWPLMVAAAIILLGRPKRPLLLGLTAALGFAGVALVISGGRAHAWLEGSLVGYCAAFGSALCMAFYSLAVGRLAVPPDRLLLPSALIGVALTFAWCLRDGVAGLGGVDLLLGLYLGAGPMGLGYYFWSRALSLDQGGRLAVVAYLTPIASTLLLALSGESLSMTAIAGAVLVIGSCIAVGIERSEA
ncbi:DMT family transporter [Mesorhizobium sp. M1C.F.Ca.ET.193.01.1.1]|uniref:DMT family transporter n=1 Tax=unclassified Mesorhizobium TaxID=325217 RepID=UPI000FD58541|nr:MULTISPECIES: DMT family transporter [unclassified Mesorhizobium]TGS95853.1 DMT family transporter [bacterium M00.F.Ca.ET.177.01.1.1]TGQ51921.1 DMT family transporter [Mesorhizobium sp. M1C.F.Ca.ET.210.01.1.1]TGQ68166.1 DMT family transporter [Mesorhizobium sp. M1C.F.Ca.ET.212.01.1.1]TGR03444.1 DMT family transporter [Mesorhizobium sp. M1C.F.Ca.ET.204.01.1.1]TGR24061.1 DMT family transporter [Mesorhizobium sp. M1C.F.Ca.ET.196.01.1.1]